LRLHRRLVALVSDVARHHIHGAANDDLAFNPGHAISCAPDPHLFPSDPAVGATGRGKGPTPTSPRHARATTATGVQGRAIADRHARIQQPNGKPVADARWELRLVTDQLPVARAAVAEAQQYEIRQQPATIGAMSAGVTAAGMVFAMTRG
jgi:hypothetical protein